jgi:hypothetical protein
VGPCVPPLGFAMSHPLIYWLRFLIPNIAKTTTPLAKQVALQDPLGLCLHCTRFECTKRTGCDEVTAICHPGS